MSNEHNIANPIIHAVITGLVYLVSVLSIHSLTAFFAMLCAIAQFVWLVILICKSIKKGKDDESNHPAA